MDGDRPHPMAQLAQLAQLVEALALEPKFQPYLELPLTGEDEVTAGVRDGAAHVLRCLKVWYDLPSDALFLAVNIMDRFLTRMKVRPRHMACISVSSFLLATRMLPGVATPDPADLIAISQCKCSIGDLERMQGIITSKLDAAPHTMPVTPLTLVRLLYKLCGRPLTPELMLHVEILACDAKCVNMRPSEIALVSLDTFTEQLSELESLLNIPSERRSECAAVVRGVLEQYHAHAQVPHKQRLVWRLSQRTMRLLRPTDRLIRKLPTISEQAASVDGWTDERPPATFRLE